MKRDERPATTAQIEYARDLILKLGYDLDWYDLDKNDARADFAAD